MSSSTPQRIVVTGGAGRLGVHVVRALTDRHEVVSADLAPGAGGLTLDVLDIDPLRKAFAGADVVVHLAGIDYDYRTAPDRTIHVNALGTWNVLQAAAEAGVRRVVLCSSVAALGLHEMRPRWKPQSLPVTDRHEVRPVDSYSVSKATLELLGRSFVDGDALEVVCLRPCTVVFDSNLAELLAPGADTFLGEYVTAEDAAAAFVGAVERPSPGFGPFLLCADDTLFEDETLPHLTAVLGELPADVDDALYDHNPRAGVFSNAGAREALGWAPTSTLIALRERLATIAAPR